MAATNNGFNHISDSSKYVLFDPTGSNFPPTIKTVEEALKAISQDALTTPGLPSASETVRGVAFIATDADITAGTDNSKIVTPAKLKGALSRPDATTTVKGIVRLATDAEATAMTLVGPAAITCSTLGAAFKNHRATESVVGTSQIASQAQAIAGTDNTTIMTPQKVKAAIAASNTPLSVATETSQGIVQLATAAQVKAGTVGDGFAISPKNLKAAVATTTSSGLARVATDVEAKALSDWSLMLTPGNLGTIQATDQQRGIVQLITAPHPTNGINKALAGNANVVPGTRKVNGLSLEADINLWPGLIGAYDRNETWATFVPRSEAYSPPRFFARNGIPAGDASEWLRFWQRYPKVTVDLSAVFGGWGDTRTRYIDFEIRQIFNDGNYAVLSRPRLQLYVYKGGSKGHDWQFQASETIFFDLYGLNGDGFYGDQSIQIVPVGNYQCERWTYKISCGY
ncbi:hypothetical protein MYO4S_00198 [Serratia phage 4S]|nr:hypothetical protein MYO4S_00198 [Serratia phage 4S]